MNENQITLVDENGEEQLADILFTFYSEEMEKNYVVFAFAGSEENDDEQVEVHAASYENNDDLSGQLYPVETDEEWELIESALESYADESEDFDTEHDHNH